MVLPSGPPHQSPHACVRSHPASEETDTSVPPKLEMFLAVEKRSASLPAGGETGQVRDIVLYKMDFSLLAATS